MKKALFVSTIAGTLRAFLLPFGYHFRNQGWQVDAAASDVSNCPVCSAAFNHVWDIPWSRNPLNLGSLHRAIKEVRALVTRENYDLVHVHTPVASLVTRFALRSIDPSRRPVVIYTAHGFHFHKGGGMLRNGIFLFLEKAAGRWTDYLVTINKEDYAAACKHEIVAPEKVKYMPGIGVDREIYAPGRTAPDDVTLFRQNLGMAEGDWLFLMVGELNQNKRPDLVLAAMADLSNENVHLAYLGDGDLKPRLRTQAEHHNLLGKVHFLGFRSDVPKLLEAADVILLASQREGLPRSIMEALCMERPCIGSSVRGTRDLLADGCGVIFEVNNQKSLTQAMAWTIAHPDEAKAIAKRGREKMQSFDIGHILQLHEELYAEALSSR